MSFLFNKRKVTSKISFTEPTKTSLSKEKLAEISADGSQAVKKLKTCTSNDTIDLNTSISTTSFSSTNNYTNVKPTPSVNLADNYEDSMAVDTDKIDESGNFANTLE